MLRDLNPKPRSSKTNSQPFSETSQIAVSTYLFGTLFLCFNHVTYDYRANLHFLIALILRRFFLKTDVIPEI